MKVVVGLGNPGREYAGTRHNVGFELVAEVGRRFGAGRPKTKFEAELVEVLVHQQRVLLVMPQTYMNASGRSVKPALEFYQVPTADLLVVCDDLNLPLGRIRLRKSGSSGGQKGLENIIRQLGTQEFSRLRIGIDSPPAGRDAAQYVLNRFGKRELEVVEPALWTAADAVETWVADGIDVAMNRYNAAKDTE